jgi:hypothetical protein
MAYVLRALLALAIDLFVCYLCGALILEKLYRPISHLFSDILVGFLVCQSAFEVITLATYFLGGGLVTVTVIWAVVVGMIVIGYIVCRCHRGCSYSGKRIPIILAGLVVIAFCYYVSVNGELNEDSRYYIGLVNTTASTGTLFQYSPYNGVPGDAYYLRRALATYEIHSAVICKLFALPALVTTRIMRACEEVLFTAMAVYLLGRRVLWRNQENGSSKSCYLVMVYLILQLVYAKTYPSSAMFFLIRAYEGKALVANVIVPLIMYLCAEYVISREKKIFWLLLAAFWGATAISSSGTAVAAIEIGLFAAAYMGLLILERIKERKHV